MRQSEREKLQEEFNYLRMEIVGNAQWINSVLVWGLIISLVTILLKLNLIQPFDFFSQKLADWNWIVFLILSVFHAYTGWLLVRATHALWKKKSVEEGKRVFREVAATGGIFVRGLVARTNRIEVRPGVFIYKMEYSDPSTWTAYFANIPLLLAIVPFNLNNPIQFLVLLIVAVTIAIFNWLVGSNWIVALSELTLEHDEANYHLKISRTFN